MQVDITVNDLAQILARHYGVKSVTIESAEIADLMAQHRPETKAIGIGGVLTLTLEVSK